MIELRTLGGLDVRASHGETLGPLASQPKRLALLTYLALADGSSFRRRDTVIAQLWPELDTSHARGSLRQALHFLRRALGDGVILSRGEEEIAVNRELVWCDAVTFEAKCNAGQCRDALALYRGDFLDGFFVSDVAAEFDQWTAETRAHLRRRATACAWAESGEARARGDITNAVLLARRAVALADGDESAATRLISLLDGNGDRAGALEVYESLAARLRADFGAEPSPETQGLIRRVRSRITPSKNASGSMPLAVTVADAASVPPAVTVSTHSPTRRRLRFFGVAATIIGASTLALATLATHGDRALTVAVLPLDYIGGDSTRTYVADGLTDQLITDLAQLGTLKVINRRTMMAYRGSPRTIAEIARLLNADAVISGSLQPVGDTIRMTAQLVLARSNDAVWAQTLQGKHGDLLRMQREIARNLAARLRGDLTPAQHARLERVRPLDPEALDFYIKGRYYWNERQPPSLLRAIGLFKQALDVDPTFALAYSATADAYVQLGYTNGLAPGDAFPKARAAAERALAQDSSLAEPHATLGFVHMYYDWDWERADREFRRAIALNPSYATAHEWYGLFLTAMGRFDEARAHEARAQTLDPLSIAIAGTTGFVLYYAGDFEGAKRELEIALREDPAFPLGHFYLGRVYQQVDAADSALAQYAATGPLRGWVPTVVAEGHLLASVGRTSEANAILARLDSMSRTKYVTAYGVALIHAALHRPDSAFAWLDKGYQERTNWMVWLNRDPRWAPIRSDPRFAALTRRLRLPE